MPEFDDRDGEILAARRARRAAVKGPRVGDYFVMESGELRRFTHNWGDGLQTTVENDAGSFHLDRLGRGDYSGGLDRMVALADIIDTGEVLDGIFWFFHHDDARAHNGVNCKTPCRVYRHVNGPAGKILPEPSALAKVTFGLAYVVPIRAGAKGIHVTAYAVMRVDPENNEPVELGRFPCRRNWRKALHGANDLRDSTNKNS